MRVHQGIRKGNQMMVWQIWHSQQEQGEEATSVPMRQGGVEPCWYEHSEPADLEGRTKVGKIRRCCCEKHGFITVSFLPYHFDCQL